INPAQPHTGESFDASPTFGDSKRDFLPGGGVFTLTERLHQRPRVDRHRTSNGACSIGGARLYAVVFKFLEQLRKHLRAARLSRHLAPDDDALARCHGDVTRRASRSTEAAVYTVGGIRNVLDRGSRLESPKMTPVVATPDAVGCQCAVRVG